MAISRAPLPKLQAYKRRMGWTFPWASSFASDFNFDLSVYFTEDQQRGGGVEYNYRREAPLREPAGKVAAKPTQQQGGSARTTCAASSGVDMLTFRRERPGLSTFVLQDGAVYHTYSAYGRGVDAIWGMYQWLDRAPLGRNEDGVWWRGMTSTASATAASPGKRGCRVELTQQPRP